ncbi:MAG: HlyD family secretion protein [Steroidobacteraceae bacterium]
MDTSENEPVRERSALSRLRGARVLLMILGPLVVLLVGAYLYIHGGRYETTDNAYVVAARVSVSANVPGRVVELAVRDNQFVHRGDVLYRLDDAPFRVELTEAQAQLAAAVLEVKSLKANYQQRQSELESAEETLAFQKNELARQRRLLASGISSQSLVDRATHALDEARASLEGVHHEITAVVAQLGGDPNIDPAQHPNVQQAQARVDRARLNLAYTVVHAPRDGIVTRVEQLQVGNYIGAWVPVFALVSTDHVWLEANFKEDQLTYMRVGQEATIKVDTYPGNEFHGKVVSISPGTGSQFSALPPENATGNWVKVVQRLPVRIEFSDATTDYPLQSGLSADIEIDTQHRRHLFGGDDTPVSMATAARK